MWREEAGLGLLGSLGFRPWRFPSCHVVPGDANGGQKEEKWPAATRIVVKLKGPLAEALADSKPAVDYSAEDEKRLGAISAIRALLKEFAPEASVSRLETAPKEQLDALIARAREYWGERDVIFDPQFHLYLEIVLPELPPLAERLLGVVVERLGQQLDFAYVAAAVEPACTERTPNTSAHVDGPHKGVNAVFAWAQGCCGGVDKPIGSPLSIAVLDKGWHGSRTYPYLPKIDPCGTGSNSRLDAWHGTSVLGIIAGNANPDSVTGMAPAARVKFAPYRYRESPSSLAVPKIDKALDEAIRVLSAGDIILIEAQGIPSVPNVPDARAPAEVDRLTFDAIRLAVGNGIIVVEVAGNRPKGTTSVERTLDDPRYSTIRGQAAPDSPGSLDACGNDINTCDSGAIIVAACHAAVDARGGGPCHLPMAESNHGRRVDAYAFGEGIKSCSVSGATTTPVPVAEHVGFTSAAAAVVAGVVVLAQEMAIRKTGRVLTPHQMRDLLKTADGTPVMIDATAHGRFGRMPDLQKMFSAI